MPLRLPIYLHFFDRELWEAAGAKPDAIAIETALKTLVLATDVGLYCGLSLAWENPAIKLGSPLARYLSELAAMGVLDFVSQYPTLAEFRASRAEIYKHDAGRYPAYFKGSRLIGPIPTKVKESSAT